MTPVVPVVPAKLTSSSSNFCPHMYVTHLCSTPNLNVCGRQDFDLGRIIDCNIVDNSYKSVVNAQMRIGVKLKCM